MRSAIRAALCALVTLAAAGAIAPAGSEPRRLTMVKSPNCGCCNEWAEYMRRNGFSVDAQDVADLGPVKAENGIPPRLASCHTAFVEGYVIEGHVPASDVERLLAERPAVSGLAVPGMPVGSPGMEGPNPERYDVLSFDGSGRTAVFSSHAP